MPEILENINSWRAAYRQGWLAHHQEKGEFDWKLYERPRNREDVAGPGIDLSQSRLAFISSAGGYLAESQEPFDAPHPYGDYSIRTFPVTTPFDKIAYSHEHYDHTAVNADPQVLMPLRHLMLMVDAGQIGALTPSVVNFMGYQPDSARVVEETFPAVLEVLQAENAQAALLVPS